MTSGLNDIVHDLVEEYDRIDTILAGLSDADWLAESAAPGWSVADTVLHLALSEAGVAPTLRTAVSEWTTRDHPLDDDMNRAVQGSSLRPNEIFEQWRVARRSSVAAFATADPSITVRWAAAPLKPRTLATTRLAEHWAHTLDITEALGIEYPDSERIRHIAWLGHATLPYAFRLEGLPIEQVLCTLTAPNGDEVTFGPTVAAATIRGSMGAFCRVGARRVRGDESGLIANGPTAAAALRVLRNYGA